MAELHHGIPVGSRVSVVMKESALRHEGTLQAFDAAAQAYTLTDVFTLGTEGRAAPKQHKPLESSPGELKLQPLRTFARDKVASFSRSDAALPPRRGRDGGKGVSGGGAHAAAAAPPAPPRARLWGTPLLQRPALSAVSPTLGLAAPAPAAAADAAAAAAAALPLLEIMEALLGPPAADAAPAASALRARRSSWAGAAAAPAAGARPSLRARSCPRSSSASSAAAAAAAGAAGAAAAAAAAAATATSPAPPLALLPALAQRGEGRERQFAFAVKSLEPLIVRRPTEKTPPRLPARPQSSTLASPRMTRRARASVSLRRCASASSQSWRARALGQRGGARRQP